MANVGWARVKEIYEQLMLLPPAQRGAGLAAADLDEALREEVRSLLAHAPDLTGEQAFLAAPAAVAALQADTPDRSGQALGRWQIVRPLGSGGMGDVFEARRGDGAYEGRAAVKVLKRGMDTHAVLQRFAQERQALARLQHPNIATLLDAGVSLDGLPYVVMEFVAGRPIDEAVRSRPLAARLALFLQLADAVAHAHRNLLVHRDLKPGNVLVTTEDQVKLLDFGIAKALDAGAAGAAASDLTVTQASPYMPHYASPEQVRGDAITTATDIYSLGALFYLMLTGVRPTGREARTAAEAARCVLEELPVRPSAAPKAGEQAGEKAGEKAADGKAADTAAITLRRELAGDLDNILLKALEKKVDRRYSSVEAMAADIRLFERGYPVSARAPSKRYLFGKLVARHRGVAAALTLAVASMVLGLAFSLWQTHRADLARDDARRQLAGIKKVTNELVFRFGDAINAMPGGSVAQEALLTQTIASLDHALQQSPEDSDLRALTSAALGRLAQLQGNPTIAVADRGAAAQATVDRALALAEPIWAEKRGEWQFAQWHLISLVTHAHLLRDRGRLQDTLPVLARAIARAGEALATPQLPEVGRAYLLEARGVALQTMATMYESSIRPSLHRPAEAMRFYDAAQVDADTLRNTPGLLAAMDRDAVPGEPAAVEYNIDALAALGLGRAMCRYQLDDLAGARRDLEQALAMAARNLQADPTDVLWRNRSLQIEDMLATVLHRLGEPEAALRAADAATVLATGLVKANHGQSKAVAQLAAVGGQRARALLALGRPAQALPLIDAALRSLAARPQADPAVADDARLQAQRLAIDRAACLVRLRRTAEADAALRPVQTVLAGLLAHPASQREAERLQAEAEALQAQIPGRGTPVARLPP